MKYIRVAGQVWNKHKVLSVTGQCVPRCHISVEYQKRWVEASYENFGISWLALWSRSDVSSHVVHGSMTHKINMDSKKDVASALHLFWKHCPYVTIVDKTAAPVPPEMPKYVELVRIGLGVAFITTLLYLVVTTNRGAFQ